jgi:DNA-binding XRE family transcriptional regulator
VGQKPAFRWEKKENQDEGISQDEMAKRLGLSKSTYGSYESGRTEPKLVDLLKMAFLVTTDSVGRRCNNSYANHYKMRYGCCSHRQLIMRLNINLCQSKRLDTWRLRWFRFHWDVTVFQVPFFLSKEKKYRLFPIEGDSMLHCWRLIGFLLSTRGVEEYKRTGRFVSIIVTKDEGIVLKSLQLFKRKDLFWC